MMARNGISNGPAPTAGEKPKSKPISSRNSTGEETQMETMLEPWRARERERLVAFYGKISHILDEARSPTREEMFDLTQRLGVGEFGYDQSQDRSKVVIPLADEKLELAFDEGRLSYQRQAVKGWLSDISRPATWGRMREVDHHVIHVHMHRLYGDELAGMIRQAKGPLLPRMIDAIEIDSLSVHLVGQGRRDEDPETPADLEINRKKTEMLFADADSSLPSGLRRRGIFVELDYQNKEAGFTLKGDTITFEASKIPLAASHGLIGKKLHEIVDIGGFRSDDMKITRVAREADRLVFGINRYSTGNRMRINPLCIRS